MTREATEVCLRVLKESNKSRFDSHSVRNSVLIISHITFPRDCRVHILSNNLSRNSCVYPFSHFSHDRANWKVTSEAVGLYTLYSSEGEF